MLAERVYTPEYAPVREKSVRPVQKKKSNTLLNRKTKIRMIAAIVIISALFIAAVVTTTITAGSAYTNSKIQSENDKIANEIKDIKIEMKGSANIGTIEKMATKKLGMVYPVGSQFVKLHNDSKGMENFAAALKKEAFN